MMLLLSLMKKYVTSAAALILLLAVPMVLVSTAGSASAAANTITLDAQTTYQTMSGWESAGVGPVNDANYLQYRDTLFELAVNDLGINRVRLEVVKVSGQDVFDLAGLDVQLDKGIVPFRQKLAARGETLFLDLCVVGG